MLAQFMLQPSYFAQNLFRLSSIFHIGNRPIGEKVIELRTNRSRRASEVNDSPPSERGVRAGGKKMEANSTVVAGPSFLSIHPLIPSASVDMKAPLSLSEPEPQARTITLNLPLINNTAAADRSSSF